MTPQQKADAARELAERVVARCNKSAPNMAADAYDFVGLFLVTMEEFQTLKSENRI